MISVLKRQYLAFIWALIVLVLCDMPISSGGNGDYIFEGFDKMVHTGFFFVLTILMFFGETNHPRHYKYRTWTIIKVLLVTTLFGGVIELSQLQVFTYRSAEWWDFFSNMTGTGMGIFAYLFLYRTPFNEKSI